MLSPQRPAVFPSTRSWCAAVLVIAAIALPTQGLARDMTGKAGFGFVARLDRGLRQVPALTFRYWQRNLAIETIAGFDWDVVRGQLNDTRRFHGGAGVGWMWHDSRHMSATIGARAYLQITYRDTEAETINMAVAKDGQTRVENDLSASSLDMALLLSFPLQFEHFLSDHSSITAAVAITVFAGSVTQGKNAGAVAPFTDLSAATIQLAGSYGGGLGYTYYF